MEDFIKVSRALISVSEKEGLPEFVTRLVAHGVQLISTGGTAELIQECHCPVTKISDFTGFPEILDGRVKTLHPRVFGGILARWEEEAHCQEAAQNGIVPIDLVVVNFYLFEKEVARPGATPAGIMEQIDIGGPSLVRAAAKNPENVAVVSDPSQYQTVIDELAKNNGCLSGELCLYLASEAFRKVAEYDRAIAGWFQGLKMWHYRASARRGAGPRIPPRFLFY